MAIKKITPKNLLENIHLIGPWSIYGLASKALKHYFPKEYNKDGSIDVFKEVKLLDKINCSQWKDVVIKYHKEVGYKNGKGTNLNAVNEF